MHSQSIGCLEFPIWILNLERSIERRAFMEAQFARLNQHFEIFPAVDGSRLTNEELASYSKKDALRCSEREMSLGEIGCFLSHVRMWQRIVDEDIQQVLILEDDILIGEMLFRVLDMQHKLPTDWEFINFVTDVGKITFGEPIHDIHRVCKFTCYPNRTGAYLINKDGAQKLLKHAYPVRWTADGLTGRTYITGLVVYGIEPQVATLHDCDSDIHKDDSYFALERSLYGKMRIIFRMFLNIQEFVFSKLCKLQS